MKRIHYIVFLALLFCFSQAVDAQEDEEVVLSNQVWLDYYTYYYFKPKWEFYGNIGYRSIPEDFSRQTFHIRPSIRYIALSLYEVHGGVGFFQTFNKEEPNSFELRPWQVTGIDFRTGNRVFYIRSWFEKGEFNDNIGRIMKGGSLGNKNYDRKVLNNLWGTFTIGPDNSFYIGAYRGFIRVSSDPKE